MEDTRNTIKETLREYCERVYEAMKGEYPEFLVAYWEDQVDMARIAPEAEGSAEVLAAEGQYRTARAALAGFYKDSLAAIDAAPDEAVFATANAIITGAATLVYGLTDGEEHAETRAVLLEELNQLGSDLAEAMT